MAKEIIPGGFDEDKNKKPKKKERKLGKILVAGVLFVGGVGVIKSCSGDESINLTPGVTQTSEASGQTNSGEKQAESEERTPTAQEIKKELQLHEETAWNGFLGHEIDVPPPPQKLLDTWKEAKEKGFTSFEAHYIPKLTIKGNESYPGWKVKPNDWILYNYGPDILKLQKHWILIDNTTELGQNDPFGSVVEELRDKGRIDDFTPRNSRLHASKDELNEAINPAIAKELGVSSVMVRAPKAIEYNLIGNIFHPEWGAGNVDIWFDDTNYGGSTSNSEESDGLSNLAQNGGFERGDGGGDAAFDSTPMIAFRPMIVFSKD